VFDQPHKVVRVLVQAEISPCFETGLLRIARAHVDLLDGDACALAHAEQLALERFGREDAAIVAVTE
jgi:hypothetical protein